MSPSRQKDKKAVHLKPRRRSDNPGTEPKTYNLPFGIILEIRDVAPIYGSQGRAVQVGCEILMRLPKPLDIPKPDPATIKRRTYKLAPRTIEVIDHLAKTEYGDAGQVLTACIKVLKVKKLDSRYLDDRDR